MNVPVNSLMVMVAQRSVVKLLGEIVAAGHSLPGVVRVDVAVNGRPPVVIEWRPGREPERLTVIRLEPKPGDAALIEKMERAVAFAKTTAGAVEVPFLELDRLVALADAPLAIVDMREKPDTDPK
jgi:hypothetical protein